RGAGSVGDGLEGVGRRGQFEQFVAATENASLDDFGAAAVQLQRTEALLSVGRNAEAETIADHAARAALDESDVATAAQALRCWSVARFRQNRPLVHSAVQDDLAELNREEP